MFNICCVYDAGKRLVVSPSGEERSVERQASSLLCHVILFTHAFGTATDRPKTPPNADPRIPRNPASAVRCPRASCQCRLLLLLLLLLSVDFAAIGV